MKADDHISIERIFLVLTEGWIEMRESFDTCRERESESEANGEGSSKDMSTNLFAHIDFFKGALI